MWGSDITRASNQHSYPAAVAYLRDTNEISDADKEHLLAGTLRRIFNWPATKGGQ
jgi:hypothetical protein